MNADEHRLTETESAATILRRALGVSGLVAILSMPCGAKAQPRPYIGYVYPAGGQQGTNFQVRLGGQAIDDVSSVRITGSGITAHIVENYRRLNNQEMQLLNEQLRVLRRNNMSARARGDLKAVETTHTMSDVSPMMLSATEETSARRENGSGQKLIQRIEERTAEFVQTPACPANASIVVVQLTIAPDAQPGEREIRVVTQRGVSNPLPFHVGQLPENSREPMVTATKQILGKEAQALRKRSIAQAEERITIPCVVNGQIASGEINRYRFEAGKGQRLVITTRARALVPFIADAVPGWFQPVLELYDATGKQVACADDYRFNPDPTILYEVPRDGEYVFAIHDSLYRGREDFVYRITIGELPFITSIFPMGSEAGSQVKPEIKGWNLEQAELATLAPNTASGIQWLRARKGELFSNPVPFAQDTLPETFEHEPNDTCADAQEVKLPMIVNGRIDKPDDWDVFRFSGKSNDTIVAEVYARRLDSPLDSIIKLTDEQGKLLAFNDDHEDLGAGINTHLADSYLMARLPADGTYFVHIGDTARHGGEEYGYRLRLSAAQPDFALRIVPSSLSLRSKSAGGLIVYAQRNDGFAGPIKLTLKDPPAGFSAAPVILAATQTVARISIKTSLISTPEPVSLSILGTAKCGDHELTHEAVPSEDRMQAFLWRHLVPAQDLMVLVFDPDRQALPKRTARIRPPSLTETNAPSQTNVLPQVAAGAQTNVATVGATNTVAAAAEKPKFTKQQVAGRLRQLRLLFEEDMLTDEFYLEKVAECEAAQ